MEKPRSYVVFKDGHEEDITKVDKMPYKNGIVFTTKSGVYDYIESSLITDVINGLKITTREYNIFRKLTYNSLTTDAAMVEVNDIDYICIDTRIPYTYGVHTKNKGCGFCGVVLAPPNAADDTIKNIIMKDIYISYEKMEV